MNDPRRLADLYDAHHQRHQEDLPFWLDLAHQANGPILELGCGTGRILIPILRSGLAITGLDRDENMLAVLIENSRKAKLSPPVIQADMSAFHFAQQFSLIILPCNTLSTLEDPVRTAMLKLTSTHLKPGGIFAAGLPNPRLLSSLPRQAEPEDEESFPYPSNGFLVRVSSGWEHDQHTFTLTWLYDLVLDNQAPERLTATTTHRLIPLTQYLDEFQAAGLIIQQKYGDFNRRPFSPRSNNLIILAQKPESS